MNHLRRAFLKNAGAIGTVAIAVASGLLKPVTAFAAAWNNMAFTSKDLDDAMKNAGYSGATENSDVMLKAPDIAENGAVVPITASSNIPGTTSIAIFVEKNPSPMVADYVFSNGAQPYVSTRIKMAKTSNVWIVAKAGGKTYSTKREVKVTIGGCGG